MNDDLDVFHGTFESGKSANIPDHRLNDVGLGIVKWRNIQCSHGLRVSQKVTTKINAEKARTTCEEIEMFRHSPLAFR